MADRIDRERRALVGAGTMALAAAPFGGWGFAATAAEPSREVRALGAATEWLNSPRLTAADLQGRVVLVDFLTYTCINWLRTIPYVRAWAAKYRPHGLVVVGVHSPEFGFERKPENVRREIAGMSLGHPVALDSDHTIWRAFRNQYWPALYFLDGRGRVRDRQFGEGEYERCERSLQRLLADAGATGVGADLVAVEGRGVEMAADWRQLESPENYLGYERTANFASAGGADPDRRRTYAAPARLALNQWAIAGDWTMGREAAASNAAGGRLVTRFHARDLHLVMGPASPAAPVRFRLTIDGQPPGAAHGLDVGPDGQGRIVDQRLHQLIRQPSPIVDRLAQIEFLDPGAEVFAFTFG